MARPTVLRLAAVALALLCGATASTVEREVPVGGSTPGRPTYNDLVVKASEHAQQRDFGRAIDAFSEAVTLRPERADEALYKAKRDGRNRVVVAPSNVEVFERPPGVAAR